MGKPLIIVESPAKIKTLQKFLGKEYNFSSSVGHIRDLPTKGFGIDVENNFQPEYKNLPSKKEVIDKLKKEAKKADVVYLAPDPDREGEAIAWHISEILPPGTKYKRTTFNEITKEAVLHGLKHPRDIDIDLVDAQQARRLLDRIVGYKISPILMRRVQGQRDGGLSAGRVQSIALKLVVDREKEIEAFIPTEYWNIFAHLQTIDDKATFESFLFSVDGKKIEKKPNPEKNIISLPNETSAKAVVDRLKKCAYHVGNVTKKEKKRNPVPPFITSSLQQEASRHYGFSASRTMGTAQSLYEGIDMGNEGTEGLITYMRTDSVRTSPEAIKACRSHISKKYGKDYLPPNPHRYVSKKSSQDAHEAIRPTNLAHPPEKIKQFLTTDQYKLYLLIWRRFVASQMTSAIYDTISCIINTDDHITLKTNGSAIKFPGFLAVYHEKHDLGEEELEEEEKEKLLPFLEEGKQLDLLKVKSDQSFTKPPPRFTEASLVKELEKSGVGRPSTYAAIMNKIHSRDYTTKEKGTLKPTELGKVIAQFLEHNFQIIMDIGFTASMEDALEEVVSAKKNWRSLIADFWKDFIPTVETAEKEAFVPRVETDLDCPKCGNKLTKIWSRNKYFYGCSNYPDCDYTTSPEALSFKKEDYDPNFDWDQPCPNCKSPMQIRYGKFGPFLGCTKYPDCRGIVNIPKVGEEVPTNLPDCPAIGCDGKMTQRRSRFGKIFFSCSNFPDCDVIINDLDDLSNKYPSHPKTAYVKKARKGKKAKAAAPKKKTTKKRTMPTKKLSPELAAIVGATEMTRGDAIKKLWEYIKKNNCQDPNNKRQIVPDDKLAKLFDKPIDMMKLSGIISKYLE